MTLELQQHRFSLTPQSEQKENSSLDIGRRPLKESTNKKRCFSLTFDNIENKKIRKQNEKEEKEKEAMQRKRRALSESGNRSVIKEIIQKLVEETFTCLETMEKLELIKNNIHDLNKIQNFEIAFQNSKTKNRLQTILEVYKWIRIKFLCTFISQTRNTKLLPSTTGAIEETKKFNLFPPLHPFSNIFNNNNSSIYFDEISSSPSSSSSSSSSQILLTKKSYTPILLPNSFIFQTESQKKENFIYEKFFHSFPKQIGVVLFETKDLRIGEYNPSFEYLCSNGTSLKHNYLKNVMRFKDLQTANLFIEKCSELFTNDDKKIVFNQGETIFLSSYQREEILCNYQLIRIKKYYNKENKTNKNMSSSFFVQKKENEEQNLKKDKEQQSLMMNLDNQEKRIKNQKSVSCYITAILCFIFIPQHICKWILPIHNSTILSTE